MKNKMNLFYVLKLNTSYIMKYNSHIVLDYTQALNDNLIVALGDNQLFNFIRRTNQKTNIFEEIAQIQQMIKIIKKQNNSTNNISQLKLLSQDLTIATFVPDVISVKVDTTKKDYKNICKNLFEVSIKIGDIVYNHKYKRLCAGAGQLRRNSAIFVNVDIYNELEQIMMCGLTKKQIGKINLAKFSAYFALYTSASQQVTTPRICVVSDYEYTLHNQIVDWIFDTDDGDKDIEERCIDFNINAFDGAGIISPRMAKKWSGDLGLDYLPSSFIVRSAWIKGLVSVFDFHKFGKEVAKKDFIVDVWGDKHYIEDIDVVLTASQFKMYKKYKSWSEYIYYHKKYEHIFSVARVNKKESNLLTPLNYQYIQTNDFTEESIKNLASYSVEWVNKIASKDYLYTILSLLPEKNQMNIIQNNHNNTLDDKLSQALLYCPNIMYDNYFNQKMIRHIQNKIDKMKIGKIWVEGAYEFTIPDLYALAEHAFGMEVKGLLPENTIWTKRWVDAKVKKVTSMRSPLVAPSENRILDIYTDEKCEEWFNYIYSGNIYNIWDMTLIAESDAD